MADDQSSREAFVRRTGDVKLSTNEVVPELALENNLENRLSPFTLTTSTGGASDIFTSSFKDDVLRDPLASLRCLVCHRSKEVWRGEPTCNSYKSIWNGKLAAMQFRITCDVRHMNHWKVRKYALFLLQN